MNQPASQKPQNLNSREPHAEHIHITAKSRSSSPSRAQKAANTLSIRQRQRILFGQPITSAKSNRRRRPRPPTLHSRRCRTYSPNRTRPRAEMHRRHRDPLRPTRRPCRSIDGRYLPMLKSTVHPNIRWGGCARRRLEASMAWSHTER